MYVLSESKISMKLKTFVELIFKPTMVLLLGAIIFMTLYIYYIIFRYIRFIFH